MGFGGSAVIKKQTNTPVTKFQTLFGVDKRALAIVRVCIGLIGLYDLIERWPDIKAHYSDDGILPRSTVAESFWNRSWFSIHMISGAVEAIQIIFLINMLVCFLLTIGYRSRTMMFLHYFFVISIQARNNIVGHGGDVYMRVISFFAMFLPVGAVFSIDSAFKRPILRRENKRYSMVSFVTFAAILQVVFLYVFSYVHKTGEEWRIDRTASYYALQLDYFRTFLVDYILEFPKMLELMTISVLYYEGFGACLFFSPFWTAQIRTIGAFGFTVLHIGFAMFMRLGIFSPICAVGTLFIYPTWFWDHAINFIKTRERTDFKIYYSGRHGYNIAGLVSTFFLLPDVEVSPTPVFIDEESIIQSNNGGSLLVVTSNGSNNMLSMDGNGNNCSGNSDSSSTSSSLSNSSCSSSSSSTYQLSPIPHLPTSSSQLNNWIITRDLKGNKCTGYKALVSICKASPILWPFVKLLELPSVSNIGKKVLFFSERVIVFIYEDIFLTKPDSQVFIEQHEQAQLQFQQQQQKLQQQELIQKDNNNNNQSLFNNIDISDDNNNHHNSNTNYTLLKSEQLQDNHHYQEQHQQYNCTYNRKVARNAKVFKFTIRWLFNICAITGIIFALGWNCTAVDCVVPVKLPQSIHWLVFLSRMDQMWSMFSPRPPTQHWWYTFEGELDDETKVELWANDGLYTWKPNVEPYSRDKPNPYPSCIGNHRWFKVYENLNSGGGFEIIRMGLGKWICREYNTRHIDDQRLHRFNIVLRNEKQHLNNTRTPLPDQVLWQHICYNK